MQPVAIPLFVMSVARGLEPGRAAILTPVALLTEPLEGRSMPNGDIFGLEREGRIVASGVRLVFTPHRPIQSLDLFKQVSKCFDITSDQNGGAMPNNEIRTMLDVTVFGLKAAD